MSTLVVAVRSQTSAHPALGTGIALAVTVALFYALCSLVWLSAPGPFLGFMNSLFHGLDFKPLLTSAPFSWGGFVEALAVKVGAPGEHTRQRQRLRHQHDEHIAHLTPHRFDTRQRQ